MKYKEPASDATSPLPFKIKKAKLESKPSTGTIYYKDGRITKSSIKSELDGDLDIDIGGQTTTVKLNQTQDTTVETQAKSYIEPKKAS